MNKLDVILIAIVVIYFLAGYLRGFLRQVLGIASFVISIAIAFVYYKSGGGLLKVTFVFIVTNFALGVVFWVWRKFLRKEGYRFSFFSRVAGGIIGSLNGIIIALVILVFLHILNGVIQASNPAIAQLLENSFFYSRYKEISRASKIPGAKEAYRIGELLKGKQGGVVLDPQTASEFYENASIKALLKDQQLLESIQQRDFGKIISNPKFIKILNDKELLKQLMKVRLQEKSKVITGDQKIEGKTLEPQQSGRRLLGVVYSHGVAMAIINNELYQVGDEVYGGRIVEVTPNKMILEFGDKRKEYPIGGEVP